MSTVKYDLRMLAISILLRWVLKLCPKTRLGLLLVMHIEEMAEAMLAEAIGSSEELENQ